MDADLETPKREGKFDFSAFPEDTLFYERRLGQERRGHAAHPPAAPKFPPTPGERRAKVERRKRIDPTTFDKVYTDDELEFMNAMQSYKVQSGKLFPSHGEVLAVARSLGYRRLVHAPEDGASARLSSVAV